MVCQLSNYQDIAIILILPWHFQLIRSAGPYLVEFYWHVVLKWTQILSLSL